MNSFIIVTVQTTIHTIKRFELVLSQVSDLFDLLSVFQDSSKVRAFQVHEGGQQITDLYKRFGFGNLSKNVLTFDYREQYEIDEAEVKTQQEGVFYPVWPSEKEMPKDVPLILKTRDGKLLKGKYQFGPDKDGARYQLYYFIDSQWWKVSRRFSGEPVEFWREAKEGEFDTLTFSER